MTFSSVLATFLLPSLLTLAGPYNKSAAEKNMLEKNEKGNKFEVVISL